MFELKLVALSARLHNFVQSLSARLINLRSKGLIKWYHAESALLMKTEQDLIIARDAVVKDLTALINRLHDQAQVDVEAIEAELKSLIDKADALEKRYAEKEAQLKLAFDQVNKAKVPTNAIPSSTVQNPTSKPSI